MATIRRFLLVSVFSVICSINLASAESLPPGVRLIPDLSYGPHGTSNLLDLYRPAKSGKPLPLVIWVHGGGWELFAKDPWPVIFLVDKGYAVASINYRLSGEAKFPAQIHDCKAAVRFLRAKSHLYNLDPDRFAVWGSSAGGHLVALLGASNDVKELEGSIGKYLKTSSRVQAVCDWCGPTDLVKFSEFRASYKGLDPDYPYQAVTRLLGGPPNEMKENANMANPITFVTPQAPPFLIMHGDLDNLVPLEQSQLMERALRKAGAPVELRIVPGKKHEFFKDQADMRRVEAFFDQALGTPAGKKDVNSAKLVAIYRHMPGMLAPIDLEFDSNGRLMSPDGMNTWFLKGQRLILCWYFDDQPRKDVKPHGIWVDTCELSKNGKAYRGVALTGERVLGEKIKGDLKARESTREH